MLSRQGVTRRSNSKQQNSQGIAQSMLRRSFSCIRYTDAAIEQSFTLHSHKQCFIHNFIISKSPSLQSLTPIFSSSLPPPAIHVSNLWEN